MAAMHGEPKAKDLLLTIARSYDALARDAARRVKSGKSKSGK
jgi:hypothetical protein